MRPIAPASHPPETACAPCGPECRFAGTLAHYPDFIWCARYGAPRRIGGQIDCRHFSPAPSRPAAKSNEDPEP